jgi:PAS domain S-box-containing protein
MMPARDGASVFWPPAQPSTGIVEESCLRLRSIDLKSMLPANASVRAVLLLSLVMLLATVASATALLLDLRRQELKHAQGEIVSLSQILSDQTTRTFDGVALTMRGARDRLSDDIGRQFTLDSLPVRLLLQARISGLPQVKSMFILDRQGVAVNSSRADFIPRLPLAKRDYFRYFANGGSDELFISNSEKARIDGHWTFYVSMRLLDSNGRFRGVLVTAISQDYFAALYDSIGLDFVSRIMLLNGEGALMAGNPHNEALLGKTVGNPATLAALRRQNGDSALVNREGSAEEARFVAYRQVAKYPLIISTAVGEEEALTPWRHVMRPIVAAAALIALLVLSTALLVVRNLLRKSTLEAALRESDQQLRHMVQSASDAILTVDADKRIVLFNGAAEKMFGIPAAEAIGKKIGELLADRLPVGQCLNLVRHINEGLRAASGRALLELIELQRGGHPMPVELSLSTTTFSGELLLTAVFRDLAERQRAERQLLESNRQLQELSASLQNVREEERARIARELHDELGQALTGMRMEVSWLGGRLLPEQQVLIDKVAAIKGQIDQTIAAVRRISSELRPLVLDDLGFAAAAGWYVNQFAARTGLAIDLDLPADDPEQGGAVATALFRVLQESLTNVARHARASQVAVRLSRRDEQWQLSIADNGVGLAADANQHGGFGLVGMRERVQMLGGRLAVGATPAGGTTIEAVIPCEKIKEEL